MNKFNQHKALDTGTIQFTKTKESDNAITD